MGYTPTLDQHIQYNRKIREPGAVRYNHSRTSPRVQHWMEKHGAEKALSYPIQSSQFIANQPTHQLVGSIQPHYQEESGPYQCNPYREAEWGHPAASMMYSSQGSPAQTLFQGQQLSRPRGIPRFQKKSREGGFFEYEAPEWDVASLPDEDLPFKQINSINQREGVFLGTQGIVSSGRCDHRIIKEFHEEPFPGDEEGISREQSLKLRQQSLSFVSREGEIPHHVNDRFNLLFPQQPTNGWEALPTLSPVSRENSRGLFLRAERHSDEEHNSLVHSARGENPYDEKNVGFSRFRRSFYDDHACGAQHERNHPPQSSGIVSHATPQSRGIARVHSSLVQAQPESNKQVSLRFFNDGLEVDVNGRPLSRPGSSSPEDFMSDNADRKGNALTNRHTLGDSRDLYEDDGLWNQCFE